MFHSGLTVWVTTARGMNMELTTVPIMATNLLDHWGQQMKHAVLVVVAPKFPPEVVTTHQAAVVSSIICDLHYKPDFRLNTQN